MPVIAAVSDLLAIHYTHGRIDDFMRFSGILGDPPHGNKVDKTRAWLHLANTQNTDPLGVLGKVITEFMEVNSVGYAHETDLTAERDKLSMVLHEYGLEYLKGGHILKRGAGLAGRKLEEIIATRNLTELQMEFERIEKNLDADPATAVTASCALLESLFKLYIEEKNLGMPADQSVKPLWKQIRKDLNFDPGVIQDGDLQAVLTGLAAIVEGIGSLRTRKGSAHGRGKTSYRLKPRHARLTAHAAAALAVFVLETWQEKAA